MTLCEVSPGSASTPAPAPEAVDASASPGRPSTKRPPDAPTDAPADAPTWGWAVVEIRRDGTLGRPSRRPGHGAGRGDGDRRRDRRCPTHVGCESYRRSCRLTWGRSTCRTETSTRLPLRSCAARVPGPGHRPVSTAWDDWLTSWRSRAISGAPADWPGWFRTLPRTRARAPITPRWRGRGSPWSAQTSRRRVGTSESWPARPARMRSQWLATSVLLVEARLLIATGEPDAATRLLVGASEVGSPAGESGWFSDLVTIARAEALLASGEPQRSLAALTPMPVRAGTEAAVVAASALRGIGDRPWGSGSLEPRGSRPGPRAAGAADPGVAARVPARRGPRQARSGTFRVGSSPAVGDG